MAYNSATVKLYNATDNLLATPAPAPIASSTNGSNFYQLSYLEAGDYFYTITGSGKGNILEYIEIPNSENYPNNTQDGIINTTIYPAAVSQTISIQDKDNAKITAGVTLKVNNYPYALTASNYFTLSNVPRNPSGCLLEFVSDSFEPLRRKLLFPLSGNVLTIRLAPLLGDVSINLRNSSNVIVNSHIGSITVQYIDTSTGLSGDAAYVGDEIVIARQGAFFYLPDNVKHNGELVLKALSTSLYTVNPTSNKVIINEYNGNAVTLNFTVNSIESGGGDLPGGLLG
jgi:hypothetical protein